MKSIKLTQCVYLPQNHKLMLAETQYNMKHHRRIKVRHTEGKSSSLLIGTRNVVFAVPMFGQQRAVKTSKTAYRPRRPLAASFLRLRLLSGLQPQVLGPASLSPLSLPGQEGQSRAGSSGFHTLLALLPQRRSLRDIKRVVSSRETEQRLSCR